MSTRLKCMEKKDVKRMLMSMRTNENGEHIDFLLGEIDLMPPEKMHQILRHYGDNEEGARNALQEKLEKMMEHQDHTPHKPVNDMIKYGINGSCVHLHLPGELKSLMGKLGQQGTIDYVNLKLLDAMQRICEMKQAGDAEFQEVRHLLMVSPILINPELRFLAGLDFEVERYQPLELTNPEFLQAHPKAALAKKIFGPYRRAGSAEISLETMQTEEWQEKKNKIVEKLTKRVEQAKAKYGEGIDK